MKLSKENAARQRKIRKTVSAGKALGGLLVGLAATVAGCRGKNSPAHTMGRFPDPRYRENATNEVEVYTEMGEVADPSDQQCEQVQTDKHVRVINSSPMPIIRTAGVIVAPTLPKRLKKGNDEEPKDSERKANDVEVEVEVDI